MLMNGSKQFVEAAHNMKKQLGKIAGEEIQRMDENTLKTIQSVLGFIDAATIIVDEQQKALTEIDAKLEKLNNLLEKM
ncbi:MAG: hypothetical protein UHD64_02495 [Bacteroidales bacterium]|nr:hypothetical protein [Bacteroidales bacterium]